MGIRIGESMGRLTTASTWGRQRWLASVSVTAAVVVGGLLSVLPGQEAGAASLGAFPLRVTYAIEYQLTPDRSQPLASAEAQWVVRSLSDWEFSFLTGPDSGTIYRLAPDGTFTATDGRTSSTTVHPPGTVMVPLPDLAVDSTAAKLVTSDAKASPLVSVDRESANVAPALEAAAAASNMITKDQLVAATFRRESSVDAYEFDQLKGIWVGISGTLEETIVMDTAGPGVMFRELRFEGQLLRRIVVTDIAKLVIAG